MAETQFETDEFLKLLTEALRAGPGSPQWHDALAQLAAAPASKADEYKLLIAVREDLESGRDYRSVRAGPGFTRKVMERIDDHAAGRGRSPSTATLIAVLAGIAIVTSLVIVAVIMIRSRPPAGNLPDLSQTYFPNVILSSDFTQNSTAEWDKWTRFGAGPVLSERDKGLEAAPAAPAGTASEISNLKSQMRTAAPLAARSSIAIEVRILIPKPTSKVDLQLFVTEDPTAASSREFVVDLKNGDLSCYMPDIKNVGDVLSVAPGPIQLTIKLDQQFVIVETQEKQLYAGPHGLSPTAARYAGLRFMPQGGADAAGDVVVQSIRILQP